MAFIKTLEIEKKGDIEGDEKSRRRKPPRYMLRPIEENQQKEGQGTEGGTDFRLGLSLIYGYEIFYNHSKKDIIEWIMEGIKLEI